MKICLVSSAHPALDKRVFLKEARTLQQAGFSVIHIAPQTPGEPLGDWEKDGVAIETYPRRPGLAGRLSQLWRLFRLARSTDADFYHCNEVDSWAVGIGLHLMTGKPCIVDIHEDYPSRFADSGRYPGWFAPIGEACVRIIYRLFTLWTARIVLAKRSVARDFAFASQKAVLVQNFAPLEVLKSGKDGSATPKSSPPTIVHLGLISRERGWPQMLLAMAEAQRRDFVLHVIGEFNDGSEQEFLAKAADLKLADRIRFDRWMPFEQAFAELQKASIGLVLFQPGIQNHVFALPHKMFDYMLAREALIAPDFAVEVREIVKYAQCGLLVDTANVDQIARAIDQLLNDTAASDRMAGSGHDAVLDRYNWEREGKTLVTMYEDLAKR